MGEGKRGSNTCRTTSGKSSRLRFSHVTADAPIRIRSTDSSSSYHGPRKFPIATMRGNDVENRNKCPIGPLHPFFLLYPSSHLSRFHFNFLRLPYEYHYYNYYRCRKNLDITYVSFYWNLSIMTSFIPLSNIFDLYIFYIGYTIYSYTGNV